MRKPELLAPAGDLERLKVALNYGADAVYFGGTMFGLRANAINFSIDDIIEGTNYAHKLNKKVYVTVNIVLHNKEIEGLLEYLKKLEEIGVDGIIVCDPYIVELAHQNTKLNICISTQESTLNYEAVKFWQKEGVKRIVLGREATKEDIIQIKKEVPDMEIECFIHGAMCASYSGRCVLSNYFTGRDANRGGCAQICRWTFDLLDENKKLIKCPKKFTFQTKDLTMLKYIPEMIDIGIDSFKIEGRMRSIYYIASVVSTYRKVIDEYCNNKEKYEYNLEYEKTLSSVANRDSITQFFNGINNETLQYYNERKEISNQEFVAVVLDYNKKTKLAKMEQRNNFKVNDKIEIFGPENKNVKLTVKEMYDENMQKITVAPHPQQIIYVKIDEEVYKNNLVRKLLDKEE
ncbi:peptidase U32 family [Firmicutes bacterium CAG:884]|mgnify:CR=1 FL=1|nr:U32 family peptidase [Bacillota bacterium]CCY94492.1 peptidase U32 family [Firmicutes bacterium CAG:884]